VGEECACTRTRTRCCSPRSKGVDAGSGRGRGDCIARGSWHLLRFISHLRLDVSAMPTHQLNDVLWICCHRSSEDVPTKGSVRASVCSFSCGLHEQMQAFCSSWDCQSRTGGSTMSESISADRARTLTTLTAMSTSFVAKLRVSKLRSVTCHSESEQSWAQEPLRSPPVRGPAAAGGAHHSQTKAPRGPVADSVSRLPLCA